MTRPRVSEPMQYGESAVVIHARSESTHGEPERRTRSAIGCALDDARRFTREHAGFKAKILWRGCEVYVRDGAVYLTICWAGRREYVGAAS